MSSIVLEAEIRTATGTGASRRLRRLENKVPAVIYGGEKPAKSIHLSHNKVSQALENESIYSSIFNVTVDGKNEQVLLKAIQRHPWKPVIMHMDFQRVSSSDVLVRQVPLHFVNEADAPGVKEGGKVSHIMSQVEIRCKARDLPEFIAVDMTEVGMNDVLHLSHLVLPKGVELTVDVTDGSHDLPVVSIHPPKVVEEEIEGAPKEESEASAASEKDASSETETPNEEN